MGQPCKQSKFAKHMHLSLTFPVCSEDHCGLMTPGAAAMYVSKLHCTALPCLSLFEQLEAESD